jgi:hypothetical protein
MCTTNSPPVDQKFLLLVVKVAGQITPAALFAWNTAGTFDFLPSLIQDGD